MTIHVDLMRVVTDEELIKLSERNPGYQFERAADGRLVVSPTGMGSGRRSLKVAYQLEAWNEKVGGGVVFDSSTGFRLPDGSVLSPDASWVRRERWEALGPDEREGFGPFCPDAVFEVRSHHQELDQLRSKLQTYLRNGARVAVLVDPYARVVEVHRPGRDPEVHRDPDQVRLDPELPGFALELASVFAG